MTLGHSERHLELLEGPYRQYCQKPTSHPRHLNYHLLLKGKRTASLIVLPEPFVGHQLMQDFRNNWSTGCQNSYSRGGKRSCRTRSQGYPSTSKHILPRAGPWPGLRDGSGAFLSFMMSRGSSQNLMLRGSSIMGCTGRPWVVLIDWRSVCRDSSGQRNLNSARRDSVFCTKIYESRSEVDTTNNRLSENKQPA